MNFETALRATEILLALAYIQQSAEHLYRTPEIRMLIGLRVLLCLVLLSGFAPAVCLLALSAISIGVLHHFHGSYNGGSDRMSVMILWCLTLAHWLPTPFWKEVALSYLALQLVLSYFISGRVKLMNPDWRNGTALSDVFVFSAYPVSEDMRALATYPRLLRGLSWAVILLEILFPLALISAPTLIIALCLTASFHLANACMFGLNRFFWIWLAAYPSLLWFQDRVFGALFLG